MPESVKSPPASLTIEALAVSVMAPLSETFVDVLLSIAPAELMPVPAIENAFERLRPLTSATAPLVTLTTPVPKASLCPAKTLPALTVVPPVWVLSPVRVSVPEPDLIRRELVPVTMPATVSVEPLSIVSERPAAMFSEDASPAKLPALIVKSPDDALDCLLIPLTEPLVNLFPK